MQRFGNLKVSSVFGFLHPETAVSVFGFPKNIEDKKVSVFGFPKTLKGYKYLLAYLLLFENQKPKPRFWFLFRFGSENRVSVPSIT